MLTPSRRLFLGSAFGGLASQALAAAPPANPFGPASKYVDEVPFQPSMLFLTWQRDPTTTMTVQWVGVRGETADTTVYCAPSVGGSVRKTAPEVRPYPRTDYKVFRAELSGLTPGTTYRFRIGSSSPVYRFRTMPARATNAIHFISGGDCGIGPNAIANNIQAAKQSPMFCLIGGDLGYDNGRAADVSLSFLRNYSRHMVAPDGCLIPLVTCIGNHEVDGGYGKKRDRAPFYYALFDGLYRENGYATLDFGDYLSLILLDTGHTSPIDGEQTAWLEKELKARKDHPHVLVVNHVPAYPSHRSPTKEEGKAKGGIGELQRKHWAPLFDKYRVPLALEHHDHTFKRTRPLLGGLAHDNGVLYLGDGSWGRLRSPNPPEKLGYLAKVSRDYHISLHRIEGGERFHQAMDGSGRVLDICRSGQRRAGILRASG
jgi:hypothetical protein